MISNSSKVYLVGAGPSGADLLTLKASRLLRLADAIVYDALVDESIHRLFAPGAKLIYVGKRAGGHALRQEEIDQLLVRIALEMPPKSTIVRLKGGDPFVFGRGGEEMIALREADIPYEVVPGVTAGIAAPAYMGIPVTHRVLSRSVSLITAFTKEGGLPELDWSAYVRLGGTLVFYMSMRVVPQIAEALIGAGQEPSCPAAIISRGTRPEQVMLQNELHRFTEDYCDYEALTPGLFVVGDVVAFAEGYQWYEASPLAGQTVLITRSEGQTSELSEMFEHLGATSRVLPTFVIEAVQPEGEDSESLLSEAIAVGAKPKVLALSSPNAVNYYISYLKALGADARTLSRFAAIAVIGPATQKALSHYGITADIIAEEHTAEGFARAIASWQSGGEIEVLNPTSNLGGDLLAKHLRNFGIDTQTLVVYRNKPVSYTQGELLSLLSDKVDWISFCSSSAVDNFVALLREHGLGDYLHKLKLAVIGPTTARTLEGYGYKPTAEPQVASLPALVQAMVLADQAK